MFRYESHFASFRYSTASPMLRSSGSAEIGDQLAVDVDVAQPQAVYVFQHVGLFHTLQIAIDQVNVPDGSILESAKIQGVLRPFRREIAKIHVADDWRELPRLAFLIEEVNREAGLRHLSHFDIADMDVFQHS